MKGRLTAAANYYKPVPMDQWTAKDMMNGRLAVPGLDDEEGGH